MQRLSDTSAGGKASVWTRDFTILFISNMATGFGSFMVNAILGLNCRRLGADDALIGLVVSTYSMAALGSRPFSGPVIDALNRKRLYLFLMAGNILCMTGYGLSTDIKLFVVFRLLHGIFYGTSAALCLTMASSTLSKDNLASGVSMFMLSQVVPTALGPGIGLSIAERFGYPAAYFTAAAMQMVSLVFGTMLSADRREKKKVRISLENMLSKPALVPGLLIALLFMANNNITSFLALFTAERGVEGLKAYYLINAAFMVVSRPFGGKLADSVGLKKVIIPCLAIFIGQLLLLSRMKSTLELWLCAVLGAAGYATAYSLLQALAIKCTPYERRGAASATCYIGADLGMLIGPVIGGRIAGSMGYPALYMAAALPIAAAIAIYIIWDRRQGIAPSASAAEIT